MRQLTLPHGFLQPQSSQKLMFLLQILTLFLVKCENLIIIRSSFVIIALIFDIRKKSIAAELYFQSSISYL